MSQALSSHPQRLRELSQARSQRPQRLREVSQALSCCPQRVRKVSQTLSCSPQRVRKVSQALSEGPQRLRAVSQALTRPRHAQKRRIRCHTYCWTPAFVPAAASSWKSVVVSVASSTLIGRVRMIAAERSGLPDEVSPLSAMPGCQTRIW